MDFDFARIAQGDEVLFGTDSNFTRPRPGTVLEVRADAKPPTLIVKDIASPRIFQNCWHESDPTIQQRQELFVANGNHAQFRLSARTQRQWDQEDRVASLERDLLTLTDENVALRTDVDALMQGSAVPRATPKPKARRKNVRTKIDKGLKGDDPEALRQAIEIRENQHEQRVREAATSDTVESSA